MRKGETRLHRRYAGAIIRAMDGRILCQLRDDKPGIIYPGKWSCVPGGHIEPGETPEQAIVRELMEEFCISCADIEQFIVVERFRGWAREVYYAFLARYTGSADGVCCNEGQRAEFFEIEKALALPQHPVSKQILVQFATNPRC